MATVELFDLCGGKVKESFNNLSMTGKITLYEGEPPPPPPGFKYKEEGDRSSFIKTWDLYGKLVSEVHFVDKPSKTRKIGIKYDLCEGCSKKLILMLETLRKHYHVEAKEIEFLDRPAYENPFKKYLGFDEL